MNNAYPIPNEAGPIGAVPMTEAEVMRQFESLLCRRFDITEAMDGVLGVLDHVTDNNRRAKYEARLADLEAQRARVNREIDALDAR